MKKIFVAAGMCLPNSENMKNDAIKLGKILAQNNYQYVQGGSDQGMMGLTLKEFIKYSKNVVFYIPKAYYKNDAPLLEKTVGKKHFKATMVTGEADRLKHIITCDSIIVLPGGTGTLEELLYANETHRAKEHCAPITVVNSDHFFDGLLVQLKANIEYGFMNADIIKFNVVSSVDELEQKLIDEASTID